MALPKKLIISLAFLVILFSDQLYGQARPEAPDSATLALPMARLRRSKPMTAATVIDQGRQGLFVADLSDNNSADDSAMTLIGSGGVRYKRIVDGDKVNVQWFGATGNGGTDDWYAIQKGIGYILSHPRVPRTLYFPAGNYLISRPLLIARPGPNGYLHSTINLAGPTSAKNSSEGSAGLLTSFNNTFAIGVQLGKGVLIKGLSISGQFKFPNSLNQIQVDTLSFAEWTDGKARQNTLSPYCGIAIDPFSDASVYPRPADMYPGLEGYCLKGMGRGGSTAIQIVDCSIHNFIVGVMITPSNQQNGELVDVIDCDLSNNKVGYAMAQAQSKECHVDRIKCWGPTHTLFDNVTYGFRQGDGAAVPFVDGVNIAGAVKQLCNINAPSFGGSFHNVYAESLFRLGYVGGLATVAFHDCQFDFASQEAGRPYPDFFVQGFAASFRDCMFRLYPGVPGARLVLSGTNDHFEGGTMNAPPVAVNLENNIVFPTPVFHNIQMYYSSGILGSGNPGVVEANGSMGGINGHYFDPVYYGNTYRYVNPYARVAYQFTYHNTYERVAALSGQPVLHVDKSRWTAWFRLGASTDAALLKPGDFILTSEMHYQDQFVSTKASTYPVGLVRRIGHDTVYLDNLAVGINNGVSLRLWMDYYVNAMPAFTGNMAANSNTITDVQGVFPAPGDRPDIPMLPPGAFVTAVNAGARTISFSVANVTGKSYKDYTFINGFPTIEIYSPFDPAFLQKNGVTLFGGADFYRYDTENAPTNEYLGYPFTGRWTERYRILNTNISGDTTVHKLRFKSN